MCIVSMARLLRLQDTVNDFRLNSRLRYELSSIPSAEKVYPYLIKTDKSEINLDDYESVPFDFKITVSSK